MDPAWSGRGGVALPKIFFRRATTSPLPPPVDNCLGKKKFPDEYVAIAFQWLYTSIYLLHYCKVLLDYSFWIVIVVHSSLIIMLLLKLLNLIWSLIIFCFIMKNSTPPAPPWPGLGGGRTPPPPPPPPIDNCSGKKIFRTSTLQLLSSDFTRPSTYFTTAKYCLTTVFEL
jgi:hypothetical protein